jgi:hypothetical protein
LRSPISWRRRSPIGAIRPDIHTLADILRARTLAIAWGYEDPDDLPFVYRPGVQGCLRAIADGGADLCSQPTVSRRENMPTLQEIIRLGHRSASSNSLPASSKPPREFVSPSPPRVGMPHCSGSFPQRPDTRGHDRPGRAHPQNPERVAKSPPKSR